MQSPATAAPRWQLRQNGVPHLRQRIVKVFNKKPGKDGLFGSTKSNNTGSWSIPAVPNGKFYAKMPRRSEGSAGRTFICSGDRSPVRSFGP